MPLADRFRIALLSIPAASLERAFWYAIIAGFAWLTLHVLLARWLAHLRMEYRISRVIWPLRRTLRQSGE